MKLAICEGFCSRRMMPAGAADDDERGDVIDELFGDFDEAVREFREGPAWHAPHAMSGRERQARKRRQAPYESSGSLALLTAASGLRYLCLTTPY